MDDKKIYATLKDLEDIKQEIIESVLAALPAAEEVSW